MCYHSANQVDLAATPCLLRLVVSQEANIANSDLSLQHIFQPKDFAVLFTLACLRLNISCFTTDLLVDGLACFGIVG